MGDAQSAQREGKKDAAAEEESGKVDEAQTEQNIEDKPLKNNGQISEINGKADSSIAEVNGHCEDENATEAILSPDEDVSETEEPLQEEEEEEEETQLENVEINDREPPTEADANEMTEMDAKQNDINEGFRRFFSNIGLKLTVKRGSSEITTDVPDKTNKDEPNRPEDVEDTAKETKSDNAEQNTDVNIAQETYDNDSTTCPTLTDVTSEDVLENAEEKTTETKEEVKSDHAEETTAPAGEDAQQDAAPEEEPHSTFPSSPEEEVVVSPIKRFFTTGIFSGLRKKKKLAEDETTEKELVDMGKKEVMETTEQTAQQQQQQDKEEISTGVEAAAIEVEEGKSSSMDQSTITVPEPEILSSQEKDKVQASPLKRLLSGSSLKKLSKKQRSRKSSDAKLSDSGEHVSDQLLSSTESAENHKEEGPAQPSVEAAGEEDGAWASFKKLVTPKKRVKRSSLSNDETEIPGSVEEPKPSEGEQISDHSTEEGKKRKDSSVSWEAVLCGSGRRRSRKTSDSDDEMPQVDHKQESGSKHGAESPLESSNENEHETIAASKQAESPSEGDGGSTWKSLKRLVTPKRKAKDEDESKENIQSDNEVTQDESFSIKKLLPGRKKRKSAEKQDQISSDEADKDVPSGDEDSETPAVVPLSEFDTVETEVPIQTQADIESHIPEEANHELQQDLLDHMAEPVLPCDSMQTEANELQDKDDALEKQPSTIPATNEEPDDLSESISKHQQLSDIPEEGIITETMATPASVAEEAARDDTIAEDLIEITSEAITAPEPASDITTADETEMISAVSQLSSESSKTSGNTTPVPVEYDIMETDTLLHQAVETISISPKALPVCSDDLSSERIVGSVSHQILETFVTEEATILEIHRRFDATAFKTGLSVEELEAINELSATPQTESISEVNDSVSTEIVSEVLTEEFNTAEIAEDEVHDVNLTHPEESIKELERFDESHHLVECLSEVNSVVSGDLLPEGEETVPHAGSLVEVHQAETETPKMDSQEVDKAGTVADETKDWAMEQEVQIVAEKEIMYNITDESQVEDKDQPPVGGEELQESVAVQAATSDSEESNVQSLQKEPEKENELETDAAKTEHVQVPSASESVQTSTLDSEESSVLSPEEEVKSKDILPAETEVSEVSVEQENKELPLTAVETEHVQEPEALEAVKASTLDSEESSVQSLEKEVISEDIPEAESVTDEPKQTGEHLTEVSVEPENKELPLNAVKNEHVQEPELLEATTIDSEEGSAQSLEKEAISEEVPKAETVTDECKEETIPPTDVNLQPVDTSKTTHVQEPEVLQAATLDSVTDEPKQENEVMVEPEEVIQLEDARTELVQEPEVLQTATLDSVIDEPKQENEVRVEPEEVIPLEDAKTELVQEPEVLQAVQTATIDSEGDSLVSIEKEVTSEDLPAVETVIDEPKEETQVRVEPEEKLPVEAAKTEHVQDLETLPSDVKDIETETKTEEEALMHMDVVTAKPDVNNVIASVTDEIESEIVTQLGQTLEITEDQKTESIPQVEQEDSIPEVVDALQTLTAVHVSSVNEEAGDVQVLGKTAFLQKTSEPCADNAAVADEPKQEVHLSAVEVSVEGEKETELPDTETKTAAVEHAVLAEVVICNLKDVSVAIPDVLIEKTSEITEPLIETMASELEFKKEVEAATPLVKDDVTETAEEGSVVMMMHVPLVTFEDNHRIQVQVVDVNIKSAETIVDSVLEVGITEAKEVIDVCHETVEKVDNLSAMPEIEEEIINEENNVAIQEVIQHVKKNLPETISKPVVVNLLCQEVIEQPDAVTKVSEMVESESNEVEDQKVMDDSIGTFSERQDEAPAVISDDSATGQQVSEDLMQTPDILGSLDVSIDDHKEDLKETKAELKSSEVGVTAEEVKSEELDAKQIHEQAQITQIAQSQIVTPSNTGLVVPQNTGIISSIGNVESPSSLSLEFKLNIQFGQAKAPASPPPMMERIAPVKQTDVSEVGVQVVEAVEPEKAINPTQRAESQKQPELTEVAVQATEITEPAANSDSTERAMITNQSVLLDVGIQAIETVEPVEQVKSTETVTSSVQATEITEPATNTNSTERVVITNQPVLLDVGIHAMETVEPVEQIKSTETVTSSVHATKTIQPVRPTEKREVFLSQPVVSEACQASQETKAEEPVKQTEENDQDVWMDAEEVIYTQEETELSFHEVDEPPEPQTEIEQEEKAGLGHEVEMAPNFKTEEEESQQEMHKTGTCEVESEGEDFAVALEHLEIATASATTMELD